MLELVKSQLEGQNIDYSRKKYLLAISGGLDSMVLFHIFLDLDLLFEVGHINYHLRADKSNLDASLVQECCKMHDIAYHEFNVDPKTIESSKNIQSKAREIRYAFLEKIRAERHIDFIVTAHHESDQLENALLNLFRGIGPKLMKPLSHRILRPLLGMHKTALNKYAEEHKVAFRDDESNFQDKYDRNYLRNNIIPELNQRFDHFETKLISFAERYWEDQELIEELLSNRQSLDAWPVDSFSSKRELYHLLKKYGFKLHQCRDLYENRFKSSYKSKSSTHISLITKDLIKLYLINNLNLVKSYFIRKEQIPMSLTWSNALSIDLRVVAEYSNDTKESFYFDYDQIQFPISIRAWRPGDRMNPSGLMGHSKKVKKIFVDYKINELEKPLHPIVEDAEGKILGIIPLRKSELFPPSRASKKILEISFSRI